MNDHKIPIPSMIYNAAVGGHVTNSQQIIDENLNREQNDINQETVGTVPYNSTNPNGMGRIVLKKNDNFKEVVEAQTNGNTIFVIKYDFTLTDNVTIPVNCILEFKGGKIKGNYAINFTNLKNSYIYTSWMDIKTLHKSIKYMSRKTLIVDTILELDKPLTSDENLVFFTISGVDEADNTWQTLTTAPNNSKIVCNNCTAINIKGWCNTVKHLFFEFSAGGNNNPFIILDTQDEVVDDLDCKIFDCVFNANDHVYFQSWDAMVITNIIVTYGRGLNIYDCLFYGGVKDSYIKSMMKHDGWREDPTIDVTDKYGGRAFWIHNNRVHSYLGSLVHFAVNEKIVDGQYIHKKCVFRGIRVEDNLADVGGSIGKFDAPSSGTFITNNTFIGGVHSKYPFIEMTNANNVSINNNIFKGLDNISEYSSYIGNAYSIKIKGEVFDNGLEAADIYKNIIKNISICNNQVDCNNTFVRVTAENAENIIISDNSFADTSFSLRYSTLCVFYKNAKDIIIKDNVFKVMRRLFILKENPVVLDAVRLMWILPVETGKTDYTAEIKNITIADNIGFYNWIYPEYSSVNGVTRENINIKYDYFDHPRNHMEAKEFNLNIPLGFSYVDINANRFIPITFNGGRWLDPEKAVVTITETPKSEQVDIDGIPYTYNYTKYSVSYTPRRGSFANIPLSYNGWALAQGFKYICTDRKLDLNPESSTYLQIITTTTSISGEELVLTFKTTSGTNDNYTDYWLDPLGRVISKSNT